MPSPKKMQRRAPSEDAASEALLDSMLERGEKAEARDADDNPFLDEDGDLKVIPTYEELSSLLEGPSTQALPMREILRRNLKVTLRAIEMAEIAYHANPRQGTATALTQMQNMAKDTIKAIEERQDPSVLCREIQEIVIKPLVLEFIKVLTSEAERKRASILAITSPESSNIIVHEMRNLLEGVSQGCDEALEDAKRRMEELLGAKIGK